MKRKPIPLAFIVDGLTKSIELTATSERFETTVLPVEKNDLPAISKSAGWLFNWKQEFTAGVVIHKLVTVKEPKVIQGLAIFSLEPGFVMLHLLENAPFNVGKSQKFIGVAGNMVAFGCLMSRQNGFQGVLALDAKTALMEHYKKTLGAQQIGNTNRMVIYESQADFLINTYFPKPGQNKENNHD